MRYSQICKDDVEAVRVLNKSAQDLMTYASAMSYYGNYIDRPTMAMLMSNVYVNLYKSALSMGIDFEAVRYGGKIDENERVSGNGDADSEQGRTKDVCPDGAGG